MNNFWLGVLSGLFASMIFFCVSVGIMSDKTRQYEARLHEVTQRCEVLEAWVEENKAVMQIYEFYNWHNMKFFDEKEEE